MDKQPAFNNIDEYISGFPEDVQAILQKIRELVHEEAPEAEEAISYALPTFKLHGNLVHFGAFKNHIGLYPTPSGAEKFKAELAPYEGGKGSIRFPLDQPIPYDLIRAIVRFRMQEKAEEMAAKKAKKKKP